MGLFRLDSNQFTSDVEGFTQKLIGCVDGMRDVGDVAVGSTPKEAVFTEDKLTLYRYQSTNKRKFERTPILIVYALVNRYYMMDLEEDRSIIRGLLKAGLDVYVIDWGYPDRSDRYLTLDDYINGYLDRCVDHIRGRHDLDKVNLLGVCQGGTFSLCYGALNPEKVRNLVVMVAPVDFHTPGNVLSRMVRKIDVDLLVDTLGNVPGTVLNWTFHAMKPVRFAGQKHLDMVGSLDDTDKVKSFARMEKWIHDSPDQAGEAFRQFMKDFYQRNALVKGDVVIGSKRVDLKDVVMPVLNVYATKDHLIPPEASRALKQCVGTRDYEDLAFEGGHIGIYVSRKAQKVVAPCIGRWIRERSG